MKCREESFLDSSFRFATIRMTKRIIEIYFAVSK